MRHWFVIVVLLGACSGADAQTKRRVYVLHSGMHVILAPKDKDHAARTLKEELAKRGVAERDIVALDSPFPTASWDEMVPKGGLLIFRAPCASAWQKRRRRRNTSERQSIAI